MIDARLTCAVNGCLTSNAGSKACECGMVFCDTHWRQHECVIRPNTPTSQIINDFANEIIEQNCTNGVTKRSC